MKKVQLHMNIVQLNFKALSSNLTTIFLVELQLLSCHLLLLRDRVKASVSESQEFETEEDGIDMSFDMEAPLEGMVVIQSSEV
jgi:hypothetical protein